jgi:hypothetical protein
MAKTMVANVSGARIREAERELALIRGAEAVNAYLESHPNETKVLQQIVEWRRAGKPVPPLGRVQRAMVWSDGSVELSTAPAPEPIVRPGRPGAPGARDDRGHRTDDRRRRPGAGVAAMAGARPGPGSGERSAGSDGGRRGGPSRRPGGRPGAPGGQPRLGGRRDRGSDERGLRDVPRAGEGWVLLRPGEAPPPGPTLGGLEPATTPSEQPAAEPAPEVEKATV